jgi:hypothetical protein
MPNIQPEALEYLKMRIKSAKDQGNMDLMDALLDLWLDHQVMADDFDAEAWGFNPKRWADPRDLAAFKRLPHPGLSRLKR